MNKLFYCIFIFIITMLSISCEKEILEDEVPNIQAMSMSMTCNIDGCPVNMNGGMELGSGGFDAYNNDLVDLWSAAYGTADRLSDYAGISAYSGEFMAHSKSNGLIVKGIEPSEKARNQATKDLGLEVYEESQLSSWSEQSFDIITMWHVLEHVYDLKERVGEIKRLLSDQGKVFIAVPNCASKDAKHYQEKWAAYDVPRHLYHFRKEQMRQLWEDQGCQVEEILPMKLDSYYVSLLSEKYTGTGILSYPKAFIQGLLSNMAAKSNGEWSSLIYVISKK